MEESIRQDFKMWWSFVIPKICHARIGKIHQSEMSIFQLSYAREFQVKLSETNANNPYVILVGWISSNAKNLSNYIDWYSKNGYDVLWFTPHDSYQ
jgi:hypothetical protein